MVSPPPLHSFCSVAKSFGSCLGIPNASAGHGLRVQFTAGPHGFGQQRQPRSDERRAGRRSHVQVPGQWYVYAAAIIVVIRRQSNGVAAYSTSSG